jgi:CrcB protein
VSAWVWACVPLLGGAGAIGRFALDGLIGSRARGSFPLGTFAVNISGAMLLGLLTGLAVSGPALVLAGTATLGSYTTFSTWMLESQRLAEDAEGRGTLLNVALSLLFGVAAAALGRTLGGRL